MCWQVIDGVVIERREEEEPSTGSRIHPFNRTAFFFRWFWDYLCELLSDSVDNFLFLSVLICHTLCLISGGKSKNNIWNSFDQEEADKRDSFG